MKKRSSIIFIAFGILVVTAGGAYLAYHQFTSHKTIFPAIPLTPLPTLAAVTGITPTLVSVDTSWSTYTNVTMGLTVRYPPGWTYVADSHLGQYSGVTFYPPGYEPHPPSPLVAFDWNATQRTTGPSTSQVGAVTVAGIASRSYEDTAFAIPTQGYYIEVPYNQGTLLITATKGPELNLVPQLQEMLKTLTLKR